MAKIIENKKGFKVIELSLSEVNKTWGSIGICDCCNKGAFSFNYIAVLNSCYCAECYKDFEENATYYPEDSKVENINFETAVKKIGIKITAKIKLSEDTISLLETTGSVLQEADGQRYYFLPHWFKRIGNTDEFEMNSLGKLPKQLHDFIISKREG